MKDSSFYALLHVGSVSYTEIALQDQESLQTKEAINEIINYRFVNLLLYYIFTNSFFKKKFLFYLIRDLNDKIEEVDTSAVALFLEEIKDDYQNFGSQFRTALDKFTECYQAAKLTSILRLTSFFYMNYHMDLTARIKSGSMIRV